MSDKNIENWEQELKKEFKFHQEPTDRKDFDLFINKLEHHNFFETKGRKITGKWTLIAGLLISSSVAYWMFSSEEKQPKISTPIETKIIKKTKPVRKPVGETISHDTEVIVVPKTSSPSTSFVEKENYPLQIEKPVDKITIEPIVSNPAEVNVIDSIHVTEKTTSPKESRKPIIIMSTDTTIVTDTSHVKHRKRDKKRKN